jgi:pSer/pThr/pTyr-binding forkhead associated (FHA) protein
VIGRGLGCDVRVSSKKVSRNHARIRLADRAATLEDLGSRNGTYVRGERVAGPVALADGDDIRLGAVELVFRIAADPESETEAPSKDGAA